MPSSFTIIPPFFTIVFIIRLNTFHTLLLFSSPLSPHTPRHAAVSHWLTPCHRHFLHFHHAIVIATTLRLRRSLQFFTTAYCLPPYHYLRHAAITPHWLFHYHFIIICLAYHATPISSRCRHITTPLCRAHYAATGFATIFAGAIVTIGAAMPLLMAPSPPFTPLLHDDAFTATMMPWRHHAAPTPLIFHWRAVYQRLPCHYFVCAITRDVVIIFIIRRDVTFTLLLSVISYCHLRLRRCYFDACSLSSTPLMPVIIIAATLFCRHTTTPPLTTFCQTSHDDWCRRGVIIDVAPAWLLLRQHAITLLLLIIAITPFCYHAIYYFIDAMPRICRVTPMRWKTMPWCELGFEHVITPLMPPPWPLFRRQYRHLPATPRHYAPFFIATFAISRHCPYDITLNYLPLITLVAIRQMLLSRFSLLIHWATFATPWYQSQHWCHHTSISSLILFYCRCH